MKLYYVKNWQHHFETNETRKLSKLRWWPKPNKHDGLGFRRMAAQKNRCDLYAAWNLILDLASKTQPQARRGYLERDGIPLSPGDMGLSAGFPGEVFEAALAFFASDSIQWLCVESAGTPGNDPGTPGNDPAEGRKEGIEGREGKEVASLPRLKPSLEEVKLCVAKTGLPESDAVWFWNKCEANGWTNGGQKIKSWQHAIAAWKAAGYMPSQKAKAKNSIPFGSTISGNQPFVSNRGGQL